MPPASRLKEGAHVPSRSIDATTRSATTESACPHTAETKMIAGFSRIAAAAAPRTGYRRTTAAGARRYAAVIVSHARPRSAKMPGSFTQTSGMTPPFTAFASRPMSHNT
jgi:hypothetical protein